MNRVISVRVSPFGSLTVHVALYVPGARFLTLTPLAESTLAARNTVCPFDAFVIRRAIGELPSVASASAVNVP